MTNILITGSTGFIGSKFMNSIVKNNGIIRLLSKNNSNIYETVICDLYSDSIPMNFLDNIEIVFHLAGYAHDGKESFENKIKNERINFQATKNLVEIASKKGVKQFIYLSSIKASKNNPILKKQDETNQFDPDDSYGISKLNAEKSIIDQCKNNNMKYTILRPSLVYGPGVKGNLKKLYDAIKSGWLPPLPIFSNQKSMIHVDDLIRALHFVKMNPKAFNEIFILTDGVPYSTGEIYSILRKVIGKKYFSLEFLSFFFKIILQVPFLSKKIKKLLNDDFYSSEKISLIGFKTNLKLKDINYSQFIT